ncbi:hypothetical protein ABC383_15650 [Noviherbaspirillum sp. 1P10PC]|uniref:integrase catalytic domain-containing protein n=1 Tax=Noviherbaspirillum sp. 1P10PC TaxID=3132292 RepID=UPI0039A3826D
MLLRVTHVFTYTIYLMPVSTSDMARYAVRPRAWPLLKVRQNLDSGKWRIGRLRLPQEFLDRHPVTAGQEDPVESSFSAIKPLVEKFEDERNLARSAFSALINQRAEELDLSPISLRRLLLRFYYFGRDKNALMPLRAGRPVGPQRPPATNGIEGRDEGSYQPKRRGRQPIESKTLGPNTFVVNGDDVIDMVNCLETLANKGRVTQIAAHKEYIKSYFSKRHPEIYANYLAKKCPLPVTLRQYRDITNSNARLSRDVIKNVAGHERKIAKGALLATGPGEVYEIDATGGRIFVVDSKNPGVVLGTPIIYLMIDRWSRFIVSVYVTLRPASWEEIRFVLLIAFTSRKRRFTNLGVNIDEERWPQGKVCARLVQDRGSEMLSRAMLDAAVDGLHIEAETLPPLCPDGKGIIERVNRELKRKMAQRGIKGVFAERPLDPKTKRNFKAAKSAAVYSLREIYWTLIDIVDAHNNSPHSNLEVRSVLRRARIRPTPRDAYLWGLKNITGIDSPPLTDADYQRLLLSTDKATLANGSIMYRGRKYLPMNAAAERQARLSSSRRREVSIKVDRSDPVELYAPNGDDDWPLWRVNAAGLQELQEITQEEEDFLGETYRLLVAETRNDAFIEEQKRTSKPKRKKILQATEVANSGAEIIAARRKSESTALKQSLIGKANVEQIALSNAVVTSTTMAPDLSWEEIEKRERLAIVERQKKARK